MARLHYIHDPLCGWCYAAQPLIAAIRAEFGDRLPLQLHAGALFAEPVPLDGALAEKIQQTDQRIAELSGQVFGAAYREGLLAEEGSVLYSLPPIVAILAAERIETSRALPMLEAIQQAHYQRGLRVASEDILAELAEQIGLPAAAYAAAFEAVREQPLVDHVEASRALMAEVGGRGFPTLVLETRQGRLKLDPQRYYGQPEGLVAELQNRVGRLH
ncbi:DsbA family protein [Frateuria aurantia]